MSHLESTASVEQPGLARDVRDGEILLDDPLGRIEEDERDIGSFGSLKRSQLGVVLDSLPLLATSTQARGIDENERRIAALQHRVDRVTRRSRNLGDDDPLAADEPVQERRLADVRTAEDRNPDRLGPDRDLGRAGQAPDDLVEQVAGAVAVEAGEGPGLPEPELVEHGRFAVAPRVVDLVREHDHGALLLAQDHRELLVTGRDSRPRVDDEQHKVGLIDRSECLLGDLVAERASIGLVHPTRVDETEPRARPLAEELLAIARDARGLVDDGRATLREPVDQRRLADVREADDRDGAGDLPGCLDLLDELRVVRVDAAHAGGTASGRPRACISTRKSNSPWIFVWSMADASL